MHIATAAVGLTTICWHCCSLIIRKISFFPWYYRISPFIVESGFQWTALSGQLWNYAVGDTAFRCLKIKWIFIAATAASVIVVRRADYEEVHTLRALSLVPDTALYKCTLLNFVVYRALRWLCICDKPGVIQDCHSGTAAESRRFVRTRGTRSGCLIRLFDKKGLPELTKWPSTIDCCTLRATATCGTW